MKTQVQVLGWPTVFSTRAKIFWMRASGARVLCWMLAIRPARPDGWGPSCTLLPAGLGVAGTSTNSSATS
jgi:hypothetical protein